MQKFALTFTAGLMVAVAPAAVMANPAEEFAQIREQVWQDTLNDNPTLATTVGDKRGEGKLSDLSLEAYDAEIAKSREYLAQLEAIDPATLPDNLKIDHAILKRSLANSIEGSAFDQSRYMIFTNRGGWFSGFASLPNRSPFFTKSDYESYIGRLEAYAGVNAQGIARSRKAVELGMTQPCEPMQGLDERIARQIADTAEQSTFWAPFKERPGSISEEEWADLTARGKAAIESSVLPSYQAFYDFYTEEYAPNCRDDSVGISATTGGKGYYAWRARSFTTTDMTPDEIHNLGLSEVARIRAEMVEVAKEAGFDTREAFIEHLRTDPRYYAKTPEELMTAVKALAKDIDGFMPELFGKLPRLPYTVLPIPAAQAPGNTTAYYERGSLATGTAGIYRVNTTELDQRPLWELPALGVHEAVPGHHHQIALQQELDIHPLRSFGTFFTAFSEGWGLYSERLGIEMGLYDTPAKQMGRLSYEMWRATRLVVDTGLHDKGWSKERAVAFMLDNTALTPGNIDAEVNRYITWPGQALAYKVGELKIRELRQRANDALGEKFDLRAFHDTVLENGAVPLNVLEEHVDRWITAQTDG